VANFASISKGARTEFLIIWLGFVKVLKKLRKLLIKMLDDSFLGMNRRGLIGITLS
jgi:hypothetical protein